MKSGGFSLDKSRLFAKKLNPKAEMFGNGRRYAMKRSIRALLVVSCLIGQFVAGVALVCIAPNAAYASPQDP